MNANERNVTDQYLKKYSHAISLNNWKGHWQWKYVIIIPVCGEATDFLKQVMQHQMNESVLIVCIVNRPDNHDKTDNWYEENNDLLDSLCNEAESTHRLGGQHKLLMDYHGLDVLLLDFNSEPFKANKGVGLARKIAADTGLLLINNKAIECSWIYSTDADVILPLEYFSVTYGITSNFAAISLDFKHVSEEQYHVSLQNKYDFKLRYYQSAMKFMGVSYNYIPLGSTLIVRASNYVKVRGFPVRSGGEDFYLLNKLAKSGEIFQPIKPVVSIRIRFSERVPFGTGPGIIKIQDQQNSGHEVSYYHPQIFHVLKVWKIALTNFYAKNQIPDRDFGLNKFWDIECVLKKALKQNMTQQRWLQFIHEWFDAFKILRSVHYLCSEFNLVTLKELIEMNDFKNLSPDN